MEIVEAKKELFKKIKNFYAPCGYPITADKEYMKCLDKYFKIAVWLSKDYRLEAQSDLSTRDKDYDLYACRIVETIEGESLEKSGDDFYFPDRANISNIYVEGFEFHTRKQMFDFLLDWEIKYKDKLEEIKQLCDEKKKKEQEFIKFTYTKVGII